MQKEIKILMLHPLGRDVESFLEYTGLQELAKSFKFIWDSENPDYVVVSEHVNTNQKYRDKFKHLYLLDNIKIYYAGEAEYPDFNLYDYAVGFSTDLKLNDRYCSLPSPYLFFDKFITTNKNEIISIEDAKKELDKKQGFCNFLYSNYNAHPMRDKLFYEISKYKKVHSLGKHLNNIGVAGTGFVGHAHECVMKKSPYKFSIASENATFNGYTSEKILTSLEAHTVPIYWGDPQVTKHINPNCFINCNNYISIDEIISEIRSIDQNDDLWCKIVSEPWQTDEQIAFSKKLNIDYINFFRDIFTRNYVEGIRIPRGTRPDIYRQYYFNARSNVTSKLSVVKSKVKKILNIILYNKRYKGSS